MVMHARKKPRYIDGYCDREETHPFQDRGKAHDGDYNDRYRKDRTERSYQNKTYADRSKDRTTSESPADKRINHHASSSKETSGNSGRHGNPSVRGGGGAPGKERKTERDHKLDIQKSALRICGEWSEHLSSCGKKYYYNCKTEVSKWEKPKEWHDGKAVKTEYGRRKETMASQKQSSTERHKHSTSSAATSSSSNNHGPKYTGNVPPRDSRPYDRTNTTNVPPGGGGGVPPEYKHKPSSTKPVAGMDRLKAAHGSGGGSVVVMGTSSISGITKSATVVKDWSTREGSTSALSNAQTARPSVSDGRKNSRDREREYAARDNRTMVDSYRDGRKEYGGRGDTSRSNSRQGSVTPGTGASRGQSGNGSNAVNRSYSLSHNSMDHRPSAHRQSVDSRIAAALGQVDDSNRHSDMDISPGSTPTEESAARSLVLPNHSNIVADHPVSVVTSTTTSQLSGGTSMLGAVAALPQLISQLGDKRLQQINSGSNVTQQAIQTLQKLQEALIAQQRQQQQQLAQLLTQQLQPQPITSSASTNCHNQVTANGEGSPHSEGTPLGSPEFNLPEDSSAVESEKDLSQDNIRVGSPTPSQSSSQKGFAVSSTCLQAAALKTSQSYELPPSLGNYYNKDLIHHVAAWPTEHTERQADQLLQNGHTVGHLYSTQVSADLKKARSLVRVSEIQATLQEQRILFLRHQTKDLENLRSAGSFMSSHMPSGT